MYVVYNMVFLCLNTDFVGSINMINICLILSTIYIFIPVSGCVDKGPQCTALSGVYNAAKTAMDGVFKLMFVYIIT